MRRIWVRQDGEDQDGDRVEVTGLLLNVSNNYFPAAKPLHTTLVK